MSPNERQSHPNGKRKLENDEEDVLVSLMIEKPALLTKKTVVGEDKVRAHLRKLAKDSGNTTLKLVLCDLEAEELTFSVLESLQTDFKDCAISISAAQPFSIDRVVTIFGAAGLVFGAALTISHLVTARFNNFVGAESFTLKSGNYKLNVLVEGKLREVEKVVDASVGQYDLNIGLQLVSLKGDFVKMLNWLRALLRFRFDEYEGNIEQIGFIKVLPTESTTDEENKRKVSEYVFASEFLNA